MAQLDFPHQHKHRLQKVLIPEELATLEEKDGKGLLTNADLIKSDNGIG